MPPMVPDGCSAAWISRKVNGVAPERQRLTGVGFGLLGDVKRFNGLKLRDQIGDDKKLRWVQILIGHGVHAARSSGSGEGWRRLAS